MIRAVTESGTTYFIDGPSVATDGEYVVTEGTVIRVNTATDDGYDHALRKDTEQVRLAQSVIVKEGQGMCFILHEVSDDPSVVVTHRHTTRVIAIEVLT